VRRPTRPSLRTRRRSSASIALAVGIALTGASPALAGHHTFGSTSAAPTLDTANGAYEHNGSNSGPEHAVLPNPHEAEDLGIWNQSGRAVNGQVLKVRIRGCAIKDGSAPSQLSAGTAVNTILFQALAPSGGDFHATATSNAFMLPFCSSSSDPSRGAVSTRTISSFVPVHLCVANGDAIALHDIGGEIPQTAPYSGPWYPQGIPLDVIANGSGTVDSFVGVGVSTYGPGLYGTPEPDRAASGFATEHGEQLEMQMVEGTGGDAYGLCPGGTAVEPNTSNRVICDNGTPTAGHKRCGGASDVADTVRRVARLAVPRVKPF
jgi:hypothetical protein